MVEVFENRNLIPFWCKLPEAGDQSIPTDRPLGGDKQIDGECRAGLGVMDRRVNIRRKWNGDCLNLHDVA